MIIEDVHYRVVFDSRGNETVECEIVAGEVVAKAMAPSGASTGSGEAVVVSPYKFEEIEDEVSKAIIGMSVFDQESVDEALREVDGTENFSRIGGNFSITASIAVAKLLPKFLDFPFTLTLVEHLLRNFPSP